MKRQARCWICGTVFQTERGALARGARFTCDRCIADGLAAPEPAVLRRLLHERHGVPFADVRGLSVDEEILRLVPEAFARHHAVLPLAIRERRAGTPRKPKMPGAPVRELVVAMADPGNSFALETLRRRCGMPIATTVAPWADLAEAIADLYLPIAIAEESVPE